MLDKLSVFGKKSAAYVALAAIEVGCGFVVAMKAPGSLSGFALVLGAINAGVYGGGAFKAAADAKSNAA